ncbi:MAG: helix-turn-helix domain-containing protein [Acidobacteriaceae bacterium]
MLSLHSIAEQIASRRKALRLSQSALAKQARVSRSTIDGLENGRMGELGYSKVTNILAALGLELTLREADARNRPTIEELMTENERNDRERTAEP